MRLDADDDFPLIVAHDVSLLLSRDSLNKSVTPAKAGVQALEDNGFRLSPE
jgi:hypothetical protein